MMEDKGLNERGGEEGVEVEVDEEMEGGGVGEEEGRKQFRLF